MRKLFAAHRLMSSVASETSKKGRRWKRIRAHVNPLSVLSYDYPISPDHADWSKYFPNSNQEERIVRFADIGCGFGGLLEALAKPFPDKLILGMEIRQPAVQAVQRRIDDLQKKNPGNFRNIGVVHTNVMKYLVRFFHKEQLEKMFFCFPDPHFKKSKHRRRIITVQLLAEYAYVLKEGGMIYTITDVLDLHNWMVKHLEMHPSFVRVPEIELKDDPSIDAMYQTDESLKVTRIGGSKYVAVFRKISAQ
jgi:tRNA (guanine-N7-)-methyltransferase